MTRGAAAEEGLAKWLEARTLVLGMGNTWRGDDAAGPLVCAQVDRPEAVDCGDAPERFVGLAQQTWVERVLLVDAMDFCGPPGEIVFCAADELAERAGTTHTTGLAVLMRYVEQTHGKPVAALGIQPGETRFGGAVSEPVRAAVARVSAAVARGLGGTRSAAREAV